MSTLLNELLGADETLPSSLDLDATALGSPRAPSLAPAVGEQRLSAFDLDNDHAEDRAYARRRVLRTLVLSLGSAATLLGSIALGL